MSAGVLQDDQDGEGIGLIAPVELWLCVVARMRIFR